MKNSAFNLGDLFGGKARARRKRKVDHELEEYFENPIIHRQIHGEKVYVPLKLSKLWNEVDY
jgi:hypothetical protein